MSKIGLDFCEYGYGFFWKPAGWTVAVGAILGPSCDKSAYRLEKKLTAFGKKWTLMSTLPGIHRAPLGGHPRKGGHPGAPQSAIRCQLTLLGREDDTDSSNNYRGNSDE